MVQYHVRWKSQGLYGRTLRVRVYRGSAFVTELSGSADVSAGATGLRGNATGWVSSAQYRVVLWHTGSGVKAESAQQRAVEERLFHTFSVYFQFF